MDNSPQARSILFILNDLEKQKTSSSVDAICIHPIWQQQGLEDHTLSAALDQLISDELVASSEDTYALTKPGIAQLKQFKCKGCSSLLLAGERSATSSKFCERVYGLDLCQFNSMSMGQLDKLLEVMNLGKDDHILELGCGVGRITEYISDLTGAKLTGVDFAAAAIDRAQERTQAKRERLAYQFMDMDELRFSKDSFSGVISIDALHFVNDLKRMIQSVQACLRENGQMGIFYSVVVSPGETTDNLEPEQTPLAKALQDYGLTFQTWDFTQDEIDIWEKILQTAEELRPEYAAEGNLFLYETSVSDAKPMLAAVKSGRRRRYLYHIR